MAAAQSEVRRVLHGKTDVTEADIDGRLLPADGHQGDLQVASTGAVANAEALH